MAALWASDDKALWAEALGSLEQRMRESGKKTKYGRLAPLHSQWVALGQSLKAAGEMSKADLTLVMSFKLTRGKMRPLMRFVDAAADGNVRERSREALGALDTKDCEPAFEAFKPLAGVGVATASLVFAAVDDRFCIMSDELLEVATRAPAHGKTYDFAAYEALLGEASRKAADLGGDWTPRDVELAVYSARLAESPAAAAPKAAAKKRKR